MTPSTRRRATAALALVSLAALAAAVASAAGSAGRWTQITHAHNGAAPNLGLARGKDGTLHVLWAGPARTPYPAIFDTPVSPAGKVGAPQPVVSGWQSVQPPAAAAGADGSIHALISGQKVGSNTDPFAGLNEAVGPGSWTLGQKAFGSFQLTVSSAAQVAAAMGRDGRLVSAWRSATSLLFQAGTDPATQPVDLTPQGHADNVVVAADPTNGDVVVAYENVGDGKAYFRHVLPSQQAPQPLSSGRLPGPQLAARSTGGIYTAYAADSARVLIARVGSQPRAVPVPKGVEVLDAGLAAGPDGRLWVFYGNARQTFVTRTSKGVGGFEPVQALPSPPGAVQYFRVEGEGSAGPLDLFADVTVDGGSRDGSYHVQVHPALSLRVSRSATKLTLRVVDAGDPVAGAKVAGLPGGPRTTGADGTVVVSRGKGSYRLAATKPGYVPATARVSA